MKYAFYIDTYQSGGRGQGDTETDYGKDIHMNIYRTDRQTYDNWDHKYNWIAI